MEQQPEENGVDRGAYRSYPSPGRPEQPMPTPQSPWPWVVGGLLVTGVTVAGLLLWVMYEIGTHAG